MITLKSKHLASCLKALPSVCKLNEMALFDDAVYNLRTSSKLGLYTVGIEERYSLPYKDEIKAICDEYITCVAEFKLD